MGMPAWKRERHNKARRGFAKEDMRDITGTAGDMGILYHLMGEIDKEENTKMDEDRERPIRGSGNRRQRGR